MSKLTLPCVALVAVGLVGACAELDHLIRSDGAESGSGAATMWSLDLDAGGGFEQQTVTVTLDIADEVASDMQLKSVTQLAPEQFLLGYDVNADGTQLLMSIASIARGTGFANIWTATLKDGGVSLAQVTNGNYLDVTPTYVPGGKTILFSSNRFNSTFAICRLPLGANGNISVGQSGMAHEFGPKVDPQSKKKVLFTSVMPASVNGSLCSRAIEGGSSTESYCEGMEPRWSPDGTTMLYSLVNRSTGLTQLWMRPFSSNQATQVPHSGFGCNNVNPCWSPDGTRIVFASDRSTNSQGKRNYDIWLINTDGSGDAQPLTSSEAHDDLPQWLNSETILFRSNRGNTWNLWSVKLSNSGN